MKNKFEASSKTDAKNKKKYKKPALKTEPLTAVAAVCNGVAGGGRKASTPVCTATTIKS